MASLLLTRLCCAADGVAKGHAQDFVGVAESLIGNVLALFSGTSMPRSDSTFTG